MNSLRNNHKREFSYYNIIIKEDDNLIKDNNINSENNINPKKCKIEYDFNYLSEEINDLNNAIVITNNNFVDCLLYELNHNIMVRKFPFMSIIQIIQFNNLNKYFIVVNPNHISFVHLNKKNEIKVKLIDKSKIGTQESIY